MFRFGRDYTHLLFRNDLAEIKDELERTKIEVQYLRNVIEGARGEIKEISHLITNNFVAYLNALRDDLKLQKMSEK